MQTRMQACYLWKVSREAEEYVRKGLKLQCCRAKVSASPTGAREQRLPGGGFPHWSEMDRPWYLYWAHKLAQDCLVKAQPQLNCCGGSQRHFSQGYELTVRLTAHLLVLSWRETRVTPLRDGHTCPLERILSLLSTKMLVCVSVSVCVCVCVCVLVQLAKIYLTH